MKKFAMMVMALIMTLGGAAYAGNSSSQRKEKNAMEARYDNELLKKKANKVARKEGKRLKKEGWTVSPGALPLDRQLDRAYAMQYEFDEASGMEKYITATAQAVGENYDGARMSATNLAMAEIATKISSEITSLVDNTVANKQLSQEEAATISESVMRSKNLVRQRLGRVMTMMECYRVLPNKNKEVLIMVAYSRQMANEVFKQAVREDLENKAEGMGKVIDKIMGI